MLMTKKEIQKIYELVKEYHEKYLKSHGVRLPNLKRDGSYTKDALVLVYLAKGYPETAIVTKAELTKFLKRYGGSIDVQQLYLKY